MDWARTRDYGATLDEDARESMLLNLCSDWPLDRLHFVVNDNDIVCSDVRFALGGEPRDIISIKQGYSPREKTIIQNVAKLHVVSFGAPSLDKITDNHDALVYLDQPEVAAALRSIFA
jgi:hypothetical protein